MTDERILIYETGHWRVHLQSIKYYLGQCIIFLKRPCPALSEVSGEEWRDFHEEVVEKIEPAIKKAFGCDLLNWACLMNWAYREDPPTPQVHWHMIPLYRDKVEFAGTVFSDPEFGDHYRTDPTKLQPAPEKIQEKIAEEIRKNL